MICSNCNKDKSIEEFPYKNKSKGTKYSNCKECRSEYHKKYYSENKEAIRANHKEWKANTISQHREKIVQYFQENPCVDCGEDDPIVLEFDHIDRSDKTRNVSVMITDAMKWEVIYEEIQKCEVRCLNCHRRKTIAEMGWWRSKFL